MLDLDRHENEKIYREFDSDGGSLNLNLAEPGALRRLEARRQNVSVPRGSCSRRVVAHTHCWDLNPELLGLLGLRCSIRDGWMVSRGA